MRTAIHVPKYRCQNQKGYPNPNATRDSPVQGHCVFVSGWPGLHRARTRRPGQHLGPGGLLLPPEVLAKLFIGGLVGHVADATEVAFAVRLRIPVEVAFDLLLAEFGPLHGYRLPGWCWT